jgi:hypothetical protein
MLQKYINENVLLIPNIIFKEREHYDFLWTIDKRIKLNGYNASYQFTKPGTHNIVLKVIDKLTLQSSIFNNVINVIKLEQQTAFDTEQNLGFGLQKVGLDGFGGIDG